MPNDNPDAGQVNRQLEALIKALLSDRPIAYHAMVAKVAGSATAGLLLCQFLYWTPRTDDPDGWFYKTQADITDETALTRWEQETARERLKSLRVVEEKRRGVPGKIYFRVDFPRLQELLLAHNVGNPHSTMRKNHIVGGTLPAAHNVGLQQSEKPSNYNAAKQHSITENTTESTVVPSNTSAPSITRNGDSSSKFRRGSRPEMKSRGSDKDTSVSSANQLGALPDEAERAVSATHPDDLSARRRGLARVSEVLEAKGIVRPPTPDGSETAHDARQRRSARRQVSDIDRQTIHAYLAEFAPELGDTAPLKSSMTRVLRTYNESGLTLSGFIQALYQARSRTKERLPSIRSYTKRFAYFLALLDEECGLREPPPEIAAAAKQQAAAAAEEPPRKSLAGHWSHIVRR